MVKNLKSYHIPVWEIKMANLQLDFFIVDYDMWSCFVCTIYIIWKLYVCVTIFNKFAIESYQNKFIGYNCNIY